MSPLEIPTDGTLRQAVQLALAADSRMASLDLRVGVLHAVVHLGGEAPSREARRLAEELSSAVSGVRGVVNRIRAPGAPDPARTIHIRIRRNREMG